MIDYLVPKRWKEFDLYGRNEESGGTAVKIARVTECLSAHYNICRLSEIDEIMSDVVLIEPLWFQMDQPQEEYEARIESLMEIDAIKILATTDLCMMAYPHRLLTKIKESVDIITHVNSYQKNLLKTIGITGTLLLPDPVPEDLFSPCREKQRRIISAGQTGVVKGTHILAKLYASIKEHTDMETVYFGSPHLWSPQVEVSEADRTAYEDLLSATDTFIVNASTCDIAQEMNKSLFSAHCTYYDTTSETHQESLMAGTVNINFGHPCLRGRPGVTVSEIDEAIEFINNVSSLDLNKASAESRQYARQNWSYPVFRQKFGSVMEHINKKELTETTPVDLNIGDDLGEEDTDAHDELS